VLIIDGQLVRGRGLLTTQGRPPVGPVAIEASLPPVAVFKHGTHARSGLTPAADCERDVHDRWWARGRPGRLVGTVSFYGGASGPPGGGSPRKRARSICAAGEAPSRPADADTVRYADAGQSHPRSPCHRQPRGEGPLISGRARRRGQLVLAVARSRSPRARCG
jgi:hypothetical protein